MTIRDRIRVPAAFWHGLAQMGIRRSEMLRASQLPVSAGQDDAHLSTADFFALWRGLSALRGPNVGLDLSAALDRAIMPPSILVAYHARDLRDALVRVARFKKLCAPEEIKIMVSGGEATVRISWPFAVDFIPDALVDATMASILELAITGTQKQIRPKRIERRGPMHTHLEPYFKCPVHWNADQDLLTFYADDLDQPFKSYNRAMLDLLDQGLQQHIEGICTSQTLIDQVRWLLRRSLTAGRPELRSIARELAISERSLQRKLNENGQSFQSLLADVRHDLACEYLIQPEYEISEIAYMLGYNDAGSFYRAFQKWEGKPPAEWRSDQTFSASGQPLARKS
ncbi:helix-turn-helix transcriptional regulator [Larsenimonas salina]|uniref:helix-turn-helix transcriptional regulator n=1 Tax=Larsenimonas salina TaxID=1295565 RepID=UPI0020747514|nr:AraC family transcriptional regulator [Larsenimonas salina]MCM5705211.1 AraC family transcriptional regulator [Larsenimonas salina]